jgi:hypothetical protein
MLLIAASEEPESPAEQSTLSEVPTKQPQQISELMNPLGNYSTFTKQYKLENVFEEIQVLASASSVRAKQYSCGIPGSSQIIVNVVTSRE